MSDFIRRDFAEIKLQEMSGGLQGLLGGE